jgi:hypothetical protein
LRRHRATNDDTRARLPLDDPSVDALDATTRARVAKLWRSRATAELRVASIFAVLSRELLEFGADPAVIRIATRAVSDEVRHADICRALAERYEGAPVAFPPPGPVPMPSLARAPAPLRPTLHAVAMGCVNETVASAWLEASFAQTTVPLARAAIRELMADDVHHARMGWAHIGSSHVTKAMRAEVSAWLPRLLAAVVGPWLRDAPTYGEGVPAHGMPSEETTRKVVVRALHEIVLPGLESLGVDARAGRAWADANASPS